MTSSERTSLSSVTALYLSAGRFDAKTQARFSSEFHRFYNSAQLEERIQVSSRICKSHHIPLDVLTLLCCDDKRVAMPILAHSPILGEAELTTQILQGTAAERQAIAHRHDLPPVLVSHLLSFGEAAVAERLYHNMAYLSGLSDGLKQRIKRIGRIDPSLTGQQAMTNKTNDTLDTLVSSMEQDWYAHYQPNALDATSVSGDSIDPVEQGVTTDQVQSDHLSDASLTLDEPDTLQQRLDSLFEEAEDAPMKPNPAMAPEAQIETDAEAPTSETASGNEDFLNESDFALLEKLGGDDWEMLDDEAIEALAGSLAKENSAQMDHDALAAGQVDWSAVNEDAIDAMAKTLAESDLIQAEDEAITAGEVDWSTLDDDAIEALAASLADEDLVRMEADSMGAAGVDADQMRFTIGAFDSANAPIPPLEVIDPVLRTATISFRTPDGLDMEAAAEAPLMHDAAPVEPERSVAKQYQDVTVATASVAPTHSTSLSSEKTMPAGTEAATLQDQEKRKPQITLTIRKRTSADSDALADALLASAAKKVELSSATEDDWLSALEKLNRDFDSESATRATAGFVETVQATDLGPAKSAKDLEATAAASLAEPDKVDDVPEAVPAKAEAIKDKHIRIDSRPLDPAFTPKPAATDRDAEVVPTRNDVNTGFAPRVMSLDDLDLVEATPDLPSATELLLGQSQRVTPYVDLVEPIDITIHENGRSYALSEVEIAPMQVVLEQLAREKAALAAETTPPSANAAENMTDLPEMSAHRVVDVEEYESLKAADMPATAREDTPAETVAIPTEVEATTPLPHAPHLREIQGVTRPEDGMSESFYALDQETRLTLLQEVMAQTLPEAAMAGENRNQRTLIDEETAQQLVMARFSNDRIELSEMLHTLSGHSRVQMNALLCDTGGEALVAFLYHIGLDEGSTLSMVLHGPDAVSHSYDKVAQLMTLYHQLYPAAAARIVRDLFGEVRKPGFVHQTIHDEGKGSASPRQRGFVDNDKAAAKVTPKFGRRLPDADRA
ncbi:DUF2336 domain-containing protein [Cohaesibacter sp. CAU 1516]|nr:DUF2336 domain-containing protein [Cohaesibacter sp. CAU 1516]